MEDPSLADGVYNSVYLNWIRPEIDRRIADGLVMEDFKFRRCLVRLPKSRPAIVEFDDEVKLIVSLAAEPVQEHNVAEPMPLENLRIVTGVMAPEVDGEVVAFVFVGWDGEKALLYFDFTPNQQDYVATDLPSPELQIGHAIADHFNKIIASVTLRQAEESSDLLRQAGLWSAPALIPYPLAGIIKHLRDEDINQAMQLLSLHCSESFLTDLVGRWWDQSPFVARQKLIEEALSAHINGSYRLSIHALVPQVEGIVSEWLLERVDRIPRRLGRKNLLLRDTVVRGERDTRWSRIVTSATEFLLNGPFFESFTWMGELGASFANRHEISHGRYRDSTYGRDSSIKIYLLLDTLHVIMDDTCTQREPATGNT